MDLSGSAMDGHASGDEAARHPAAPLERAIEEALELRKTVRDLRDPTLNDLIDLILLELGRRVAGRQ